MVAGCLSLLCFFFFFNDTATTEIYTLSLHDALPICQVFATYFNRSYNLRPLASRTGSDRKSTRLNSSHTIISYAVFCLKKNKHFPSPEPLRRSLSTPLPPRDAPTAPLGPPLVHGAPRLQGVRPPAMLLVAFFFLRNRRPPSSTLFPSPPLFR